jgi:crotonobetainyl-CoA:carnitine CoA-transferase CaiB-like acyl-CoA transferase
MAPHGVYPCADGWVAIAVRNDAEWRALAELIGCTDARFGERATRVAHADALDELVAGWTATLAEADVEALLQELGIPAHVALDSETALADPQLAARGHFVELEHPLFGRTVVQGSRFRLSETPASVSRPAPTLGRDNDHVLRDLLGYADPQIAHLGEIGALT